MIRESKDLGALLHSSSFPERVASYVARKRRRISASKLLSLAYHRERCADENQNASTSWEEAMSMRLSPFKRALEAMARTSATACVALPPSTDAAKLQAIPRRSTLQASLSAKLDEDPHDRQRQEHQFGD